MFDAKTSKLGLDDAQSKDLTKFKATCRIVNFDKKSGKESMSVSDNCQSWRFSGRSLIAQHPHSFFSNGESEKM